MHVMCKMPAKDTSKNASDESGTTRRDRFIDAMFYRLASGEVWGRQNWHWVFYEAVRNLALLLVPATMIVTFYAMLRMFSSNLSHFMIWSMLSISDLVTVPAILLVIGTTAVASILVWLGPQRFLKNERDGNCEVYYRHRAWIVLAYLIDQNIDAHSGIRTAPSAAPSIEQLG